MSTTDEQAALLSLRSYRSAESNHLDNRKGR